MLTRYLVLLDLALLAPFGSAFGQDPPSYNCSTQPDGAFTPIVLKNGLNMELSFIPYGGTVTKLVVGGTDVLLGFDNLEDYCGGEKHPYFGALIGRVANRIAQGSFDLNGRTYHTPINEPPPDGGNDTLHGGFVGFDRRVWDVAVNEAGNGAMLRYDSFDGEEGFPGAVTVVVNYTVALDSDIWWIDYRAVRDKVAHGDEIQALCARAHCTDASPFIGSGALGGLGGVDRGEPVEPRLLQPQWRAGRRDQARANHAQRRDHSCRR